MLKNRKKSLICTTSLFLMLLLPFVLHVRADQTSDPSDPVSKVREQLQNLVVLIQKSDSNQEAAISSLENGVGPIRFAVGECLRVDFMHESNNADLVGEKHKLERELKGCL